MQVMLVYYGARFRFPIAGAHQAGTSPDSSIILLVDSLSSCWWLVELMRMVNQLRVLDPMKVLEWWIR